MPAQLRERYNTSRGQQVADDDLPSRHVRLTVQVFACAGNIAQEIMEHRILQKLTASLLSTLRMALIERRVLTRLSVLSRLEPSVDPVAVELAKQRGIVLNQRLVAGWVERGRRWGGRGVVWGLIFVSPILRQPPADSKPRSLGLALRCARSDRVGQHVHRPLLPARPGVAAAVWRAAAVL